jgi:hypothetical protein
LKFAVISLFCLNQENQRQLEWEAMEEDMRDAERYMSEMNLVKFWHFLFAVCMLAVSFAVIVIY